jgi:crossover junction endodeoxyribonuclease RusA
MISLDLPLPPSVNHYYRRVMIGRFPRTLISKAGREYTERVAHEVGQQLGTVEPLTGRLEVKIDVWPRDRRKTDIDNYCKSLLDSLTKAGVWADDSQIDWMCIERKEVLSGGKCRVAIVEVSK